MMEFEKFPRTPHIFVLPGLNIRDDKVLSESEANELLTSTLVIEEKVDGANIGISIQHGQLKIQNRGSYIEPGFADQFNVLWDWAYNKLSLFEKHLQEKYILFGEWCYAKHSIKYSRLPDFFIGFDLFDKDANKFMSTRRRNEFFKQLKIHPVPEIARKKISKPALIQLVSETKSKFYDGEIEGVYLRLESDQWLLQRAKLVRKEFVQEISKHWRQGPMIVNEIDPPKYQL